MKNKLIRFWNLKPFGLLMTTAILSKVIYVALYEKISSFFWKFNLKNSEKNVLIQKGAVIRYPKNVSLGKNVSIGRNCQITSEYIDSSLVIQENSHKIGRASCRERV